MKQTRGHIVVLSLLPVVQLIQIKVLQQWQVMFLFLSISAEWTILEGMTVFQCHMSYDWVSDILQAPSVQLLEMVGGHVDTYLPLRSWMCVMHTCCVSGGVLAVCFLSSWSTTWKKKQVKLCGNWVGTTGVFAVLVCLASWLFRWPEGRHATRSQQSQILRSLKVQPQKQCMQIEEEN